MTYWDDGGPWKDMEPPEGDPPRGVYSEMVDAPNQVTKNGAKSSDSNAKFQLHGMRQDRMVGERDRWHYVSVFQVV